MRTLSLVITLVSIFVLVGCSQGDKGGQIRITAPANMGQEGSCANTTRKMAKTVTIDVTQPSNPKDEASVTYDGIKARVGASRGVDQAIAQTKPLTWGGMAVCILGVAVFVGRRWFPMIPAQAGGLLLALGAGFIAMPIFLDRYLGWVALAAGVLLVGVVAVYAYKSNWFEKEIGPEVQQKLRANKDNRAAGALAYLSKNAPMASKANIAASTEVMLEAQGHETVKKKTTE